MLNRNTRTLSANTHRLNLGTRSFVVATSGNNGESTLRALSAQQGDFPRDGMPGDHHPSILIGMGWSSMFGIPCSPRVVAFRSVTGRWPVAEVDVDVAVSPSRPERLIGSGERDEVKRQPKRGANPMKIMGYASPRCAASRSDVRPGTRGLAGLTSDHARLRATSPAAARHAAAGG